MAELIVMIVLWLLSYFLSKKAGAKSGTAALVATGVTAGAYYTGATKWAADGVTKLVSGGATSSAAGSTTTTAGDLGKITTGSSGWGTVGSVVSGAVSTGGDVLKSWGPGGTAGVLTTGAALSGGIDSKWLWIGAGVAALVVLRK